MRSMQSRSKTHPTGRSRAVLCISGPAPNTTSPTGGVVEFAIGEYWHSQTTISMDVHTGPYVPNLLRFVEEEGLLEPSLDFDAVVGRFVEREQVL